MDLTNGGWRRKWITFSITNIIGDILLDKIYDICVIRHRAILDLALIIYRHAAKHVMLSLILENSLVGGSS